MQISHQFEVNVPADMAFTSLQDVRLLAACLPGCKDVKDLGNDQYSAVIQVAIAFLKLTFSANIQLTEVVAPTSLKAKVVAKPMALAGQLSMAADLTLTQLAESTTQIAYTIDLSITGKLGSVGQSAFRAKGEEMGGLFAQNVKATLERASAGVVA